MLHYSLLMRGQPTLFQSRPCPGLPGERLRDLQRRQTDRAAREHAVGGGPWLPAALTRLRGAGSIGDGVGARIKAACAGG